MSVFDGYADFYDLYYADKDYANEVAFVLALASRFGMPPRRVLDMGCGTGRHLVEFATRGLSGTGFDRSERMLAAARERLAAHPVGLNLGDLTTYRDKQHYDLVVSMFAVMGYLVDNAAMLAGLQTAAQHLAPEGVFIFDGWFGPAVLAQKPEQRSHRYEQGGELVTRRVRPTLNAVTQSVRVEYDVTVERGGAVVRDVHEEHVMRFLFVQEVALAATAAGLDLLHACPFLEPDGTLTTDTWNVCFVARRRPETPPAHGTHSPQGCQP